MSLVVLRSVKDRPVAETVEDIMARLNWEQIVKPGAKVVLKPNLCTERAEMIHSANTGSLVIRAVCEVLLTRTRNITIGESDGARYTAEAAFENNGVCDLARELNINVMNFSRDELVAVNHPRLKGWGFSRTFLDADVFITLPVMKTHASTVFTGALKNQWGCIPRYDRILLHKYLHRLIADVNKIKPPQIAIMDGLVGMQGRGPINGYPINLGVLLGSADPVALDATAMRLIGLDPLTSEHVKRAAQAGLGKIREEEIEIDGDFAAHRTKVEPARRDWAIILLNILSRSRLMTKYMILDDRIFYPARRIVLALRRLTA